MSCSFLENISIILVRPKCGGNVGAVCRAMHNMGFSKLTIVQPRDLHINEIESRSCDAFHIFKQATQEESIGSAIANLHFAIGTTARAGYYRDRCISPREIATLVKESGQNLNIGILFGPEESGLTNQDLSLCTHLVTIPTSTDNTSLNLSHAVAICCYEMHLASLEKSVTSQPSAPPATAATRQKLFESWEELSLRCRFTPIERREHMQLRLRRILSSVAGSDEDLGILIGIARAGVEGVEKK